MHHLLRTLDDEVRALEALVQCTQREHQLLLAFEPEPLDAVLAEKERLLAHEDALRAERERLVQAALASIGAPRDKSTLTDLMDAAPKVRSCLLSRRERLRALLGALGELNAAARFHAGRTLRWARSCRRTLAPGATTGYGRDGRTEAGPRAGLRLNACV